MRKVRWVLKRGPNNKKWPKLPVIKGPNPWKVEKNKIRLMYA